jgi:2-polyprenyl-3-methyl-5-hydroxy-6-metoxy-1,4-benzoquinol methylase
MENQQPSGPPVQHLPKAIDESGNRRHYYETLWKRVGLGLLPVPGSGGASATLLDYGCGRGETLALAREAGWQASGTDLDPECVGLSRRHGDAVCLEQADAPHRQFGEGSYFA